MLKNLIKQLANEQIELKKKRKTGTLPELPTDNWGYLDCSRVPKKIREAWNAAGAVQDNKARITAALNLYHEMRGSSYRHKVPDDWMYQREYESYMAQLREQSGVV